MVSVLAQFSQYGLGTTLIPIDLKVRNATPETIGVTSGAFWLGMLVGLIVAGQLTRKLGFRMTLVCGIAMSSLSFVLMPLINWHLWAIPAAAIGFGTGLRWIALETWLYSLVPANARGRIVGIHETLLGIAAILGALLVVVIDATKPDAFWIAVIVMLIGFIPLTFATTINAHPKEKQAGFNLDVKYWLGFGAIVAGLGGYVEGSLLALLPVYSADAGLTAKDAAWLLTIFQIGAMAFQFPIGWMADKHGLIKTTSLFSIIALAIPAIYHWFWLHITNFDDCNIYSRWRNCWHTVTWYHLGNSTQYWRGTNTKSKTGFDCLHIAIGRWTFYIGVCGRPHWQQQLVLAANSGHFCADFGVI